MNMDEYLLQYDRDHIPQLHVNQRLQSRYHQVLSWPRPFNQLPPHIER
jgi:hypothetical protein